MVAMPQFTSARQRQLSWMPPGAIIKQDDELIASIRSYGYTRAIGYGSVDFLHPFIEIVEHAPEDLVIYIETDSYDFDSLIDRVNHILAHELNPGGRLYLSFNKYQAAARCYANDLPEDYDLAILQYLSAKITAKIEQYLPCGDDRGLKFNWVHPLTRFYFRTA